MGEELSGELTCMWKGHVGIVSITFKNVHFPLVHKVLIPVGLCIKADLG